MYALLKKSFKNFSFQVDIIMQTFSDLDPQYHYNFLSDKFEQYFTDIILHVLKHKKRKQML